MKKATKYKCESVRIPVLNNDILGFNHSESNELIINSISYWLAANKDTSIKDVYLFARNNEEYNHLQTSFNEIFPAAKDES